jgi:site-specific DNA-methyltransferase (adenine-specific)
VRVENGPGWELRLGDFREVLQGVRCDHIISDPPYLGAGRGGAGEWAFEAKFQDGRIMGYPPCTRELLEDYVRFASKATRIWCVTFNDFPGTSLLALDLLPKTGAVVAEPIGWVKPPSLVPTRGNNWLPEKGTEFITAARWARDTAKGRVIPGAYVSRRNSGPPRQLIGGPGGKPLELMRSIVRDFTSPGETICDLFAGWGTTLLAAVMEGRRAIGAEIRPEIYEQSVTRLRAGWTGQLPFGEGAA